MKGETPPQPASLDTFDMERWKHCLQSAEDLFERQPDTSYNVGSYSVAGGSRISGYCDFLEDVVSTLREHKRQSTPPRVLLVIVHEILERAHPDKFVGYQVERAAPLRSQPQWRTCSSWRAIRSHNLT